MREFNEEGLKTFRLGRARFLRRKGEDESWKDWLSCLEKKMVFGFECHWETGRLGRLVSEELREQGELSLRISFESDPRSNDCLITNVQSLLGR